MALKIAVIGCGAFSHLMHGPSYAKYAALHEETVLAACSDIDEAKAVSFQERFGFRKHYTDYREMLQQEQPDAVVLHVSIPATARLAVDILELGYPLLMEKPPGTTKAEAEAIVAAAERSKAPAKVALNRRYMPLMRKLKELLNESSEAEQGNGIRHIQMEMVRFNRKYEFSTTAIHVIDALRFLAGADYAQIRFHYKELPKDSEQAVNVLMDCTMKNGTTAVLSIIPTAGGTVERAAVHLKGQSYYVRLPVGEGIDEQGELTHIANKQQLTVYRDADFIDETEKFEKNGFYAEIAAFLEGQRAMRPAGIDIREALQSVEVAEAIRNRVAVYEG